MLHVWLAHQLGGPVQCAAVALMPACVPLLLPCQRLAAGHTVLCMPHNLCSCCTINCCGTLLLAGWLPVLPALPVQGASMCVWVSASFQPVWHVGASAVVARLRGAELAALVHAGACHQGVSWLVAHQAAVVLAPRGATGDWSHAGAVPACWPGPVGYVWITWHMSR